MTLAQWSIPARLLGEELKAHPLTPGRVLYLLKTKLGDGLRTAYYRDVVRPQILSTGPVEQTDDASCEIHVLTSDRDWLNLLWTLKSFYAVTDCRYALCIHGDGTLSAEVRAQMRAAFPQARIIARTEADARVEPMIAKFPRSLAFRKTNNLALKVFDFHAYLEADRMLLLDSDILFFAPPAHLLALIADPAALFNSLNKDWRPGYTVDLQEVQPLLDFELPPLINAGLGLIHRDSVPFDLVEEFFHLPRMMSHVHQIEQTLVALCSAKFGYRMLPEEYDVYMGPRRPALPLRHYSGPIRALMYDEGMRHLVRNGFFEKLGWRQGADGAQ